MPIAFIWEEKFNVGDDEINRQHKYIFELANKVQNATLYESGKYIMELFKYSGTHFKHEEQQMKEVGFPGLYKHIELHDELITKLSEISLNFIKTEQEFTDFKNFIYNWITQHILADDMKYFEFEKLKK